MKHRSTKQLSATLEVLAASTDHPTAEQVFRRVRRRLPRVSLGTVYRNLEKLHAQGRLRIVWLGGGVAHYDAVTEEHDHFLCEACGAVRDLAPEPFAARCAHLLDAGCVVHRRATAVYGLCPACARRAVPDAARGARAKRGGPRPKGVRSRSEQAQWISPA
jgi:Fe2+ or Zn2+ uptake regulation protein